VLRVQCICTPGSDTSGSSTSTSSSESATSSSGTSSSGSDTSSSGGSPSPRRRSSGKRAASRSPEGRQRSKQSRPDSGQAARPKCEPTAAAEDDRSRQRQQLVDRDGPVRTDRREQHEGRREHSRGANRGGRDDGVFGVRKEEERDGRARGQEGELAWLQVQ
jgi:hypothetical protein